MVHQEIQQSPDRVAVAVEFADESMEANSEITGALIVGVIDAKESAIVEDIFTTYLAEDSIKRTAELIQSRHGEHPASKTFTKPRSTL